MWDLEDFWVGCWDTSQKLIQYRWKCSGLESLLVYNEQKNSKDGVPLQNNLFPNGYPPNFQLCVCAVALLEGSWGTLGTTLKGVTHCGGD